MKQQNGSKRKRREPRLNTEIEQTFLVSSNEDLVRERLEKYFRSIGYDPVDPGEGGGLQFRRPLPALYSVGDPATTVSIAELRLSSRGLETEVWCRFRVTTAAGLPWERWYWTRELKLLRTALEGGPTGSPLGARWAVLLLSFCLIGPFMGLMAALSFAVTFHLIQWVSGWSPNTVGWVSFPVFLALFYFGLRGLERLVLARRTFKWRPAQSGASPQRAASDRIRSKIKLWLLVIGVAVAALALLIANDRPTQWHEVTSEDGTFSILMPGPPVQSVETLNTKAGPIDQPGYTVERDAYEWFVRYSDTRMDIGREDLRDRMFVRMRDDLMKSVQSRMVGETGVYLNGHRGRQIHLEGSNHDRLLVVRVFLAGQRIYIVGVGSLTKKDVPRDTDKFFDSFKLLPKDK